MRRLIMALLLVCLVAAPPVARADDYPSRPVKIIVPYAPGGLTDVIARLYAQELSGILGGRFIVENRPGAGTLIGARAAYEAAPDGYTLFMATIASNSLSRGLHEDLPYDAEKFVPIGLMGLGTFALVSSPTLPAKRVADLVKIGKERSRGLTYGSSGVKSPGHLLAYLFGKDAGLKLTHVPYKGSSETAAALLNGQIDFVFDGTLMTMIKNGSKQVLLATTSEKPWPGSPETMAQAGYPNVTMVSYLGLVAPPGTSQNLVQKLNDAMLKALEVPSLTENLQKWELMPEKASPDQFNAIMKAQTARWEPVIRSLSTNLE